MARLDDRRHLMEHLAETEAKVAVWACATFVAFAAMFTCTGCTCGIAY